MFGIRKTRTSSRRDAAPRLRTRLGCEQLGDRINPTVVGGFTGSATGTFTYDETQINPDLSSQTLILSGMEFTTSPDLHYVAESDAVAHLAYGQFVSLDAFDATCDNYTGEPDLTVSVDGTTATYTIHGTNQTYQGTGEVDLDPQGTVSVDFSPMGVAEEDTITIQMSLGGQSYLAKVPIADGTFPANIALAVKKELEKQGVTNVKVNGTFLTIKGFQPGDEFTLKHTNADNGNPRVTPWGF